MLKIAQRRSLLNQLREKVNMPGAYLEGFFKPELDRVMVDLKELDDLIRAELSGKSIGSASPQIAQSAKDILKSAKQNFNRREYISGVADLGMFHKKMFDIVQNIVKFEVDINKIHHKFLFDGVNDDKLQQLRQHMERKANQELSQYFIKEAGIMDFFYNIGTKRGRGLAAWEKKYPKETKELREWGNQLVNSAEMLLANTIARLKEMATARAIRRPDDYVDAANKIKAEFDKFDSGSKGFKNYYNSVIVPFLKIKDSISQEKPESTPENKSEMQPVSVPDLDIKKPTLQLPVQPPDSTPEEMPSSTTKEPFKVIEEQSPNTQAMPPAQTVIDEQAPATVRSPAPEMPPSKPKEQKITTWAHTAFYNALNNMQNENPTILASFISKYANSIKKQDPNTANKLFDIVKQIRK